MAERSGCVVTVGTYDGVHLGHRRLLAEAMDEGRRRGLPTVAVTFDRLPTEVLRPELAPRLLTGLEHKLALLEATGVDRIEVLHFDAERARESAEDFVTGDLVGRLGDVALLERLAAEQGFTARGIELYIDDETRTVVSSSRIRNFLETGAVGEAARLLGRPHEVRGHLDGARFVLDGRLALPPAGRYPVAVGVPGADAAAAWGLVGDETELDLELEGALADPGALLAVRFVGHATATDEEASAQATEGLR
jgi:riboflavin kinase/FMN adenylyltransferase